MINIVDNSLCDVLNIEVSPNDTICKIETIINEKKNLDNKKYYLYYNFEVLGNDKTLQDYNIQEYAIINLNYLNFGG